MLVRNCTIALVVTFVLGAATKTRGADEGLDAAKLVGSWSYASGQRDGQDLDADHFAGQKVEITAETITLAGDDKFVMSYELDTSTTPVSIELTIDEGPVGVGATAAGIIALDGDQLKLCYPAMGGDTPESFAAPDGSGLHLFVLNRDQAGLDIVGTWTYASGQKDGEDLDEDHFAGQTVEITDDTITLGGQATFVIEYELDASSQPATLDLEITGGPFGVGAKSTGILELKDGQLKLCYSARGGDTPESFEAPDGSGLHSFVLNRVQPTLDVVGTWTYESGQRDGQDLDAEHFAGGSVVITDETFTLKADETFVMTYEFDTSKTPTRVTFTITESPFGAGATAEGVIELKDGKLKLCYAPMGGDAPTTFEAPADSGLHMFVLKREKE